MTQNVCFLCFVAGRRTFDLINTYLQELYEKITDLKIFNSHPLCYICHKRLLQCHQLVQLAQQTEGLLRGFQENSSEIQNNKARFLVDLSIQRVLNFSIPTNDKVINVETTIKEENVAEEEYNLDDIDIVENIPFIDEEDTKNYLNLTNCSDNELKLDVKIKSETYLFTEDSSSSVKNDIVQTKLHTEDKLFACDHCNFKCLKRNLLLKHIKTHICRDSLASNISNYKCSNKRSFQKNNLTNCIKQTREKWFSCDMCHYISLHRKNLITHKRIHTREKTFSCDMCNYKSMHKGSFERHKRIHAREKPFSCDMCNYRSTHKGALKRHKRIHTGEKPYSCDLCEFKTSQTCTLTNHKRTHTGEKPYSCDMCNYKCSQKSTMTRHKRIHTGDKPYSCDTCNYKCSQKGAITRHKRIHAEEKTI